MAIPYKAVRVPQPGVPGGGTFRYQARVNGRTKLSIYELSDDIAKESTVSPADVMAVITALVKHIPGKLLRGISVELGDLGTFSVHIKSMVVNTPEEVTGNTIKGASIHFRPGVMLKKEVKTAKYVKSTKAVMVPRKAG